MAAMAEAAKQTKNERFAAVAAVLAGATTRGEIEAADALRILKHELRRRNTNRALKALHRSTGAEDVIKKYGRRKKPIPKNGSPDALHCDHVFPLDRSLLETLTTPDEWLARLNELDSVVCVTAAENYRLEVVERAGHTGWDKYAAADIEVHEVTP